MRILFLGDVVGTPGVNLIKQVLPEVRQRLAVDVVIANGENATHGSGLHPRDYKMLRTAGVDAVTLGDHIYKKFDIADVLNTPSEPIVKPANFPESAPGREHCVVTVNGSPLAVISLLGRTFMRPVDCPFLAVDRVLSQLPAEVRLILVDMHAEATADKYLMLHHLQGRVTAVLGTHTHVPTADEQILHGTAFQCDVGMCGPHDSILGRRADRVLMTAVNFTPTPFDVATDDVRLNGALIDAEEQTGRALSIQRFRWPRPVS